MWWGGLKSDIKSGDAKSEVKYAKAQSDFTSGSD